MSIRGRIKTDLLVLAAILAALLFGYVYGRGSGRAGRDAALREKEAAEARARGLQAAVQSSRDALRDSVGRSLELAGEVKLLEAELAAVGAREPEVIETTRWRARPIPVKGDRILVDVPVPADCESCWSGLPDFELEPRGAEARLRTEKGNVFAVGTVELWRTAPPPEALLGVTGWRQDVTEVLRIREPEPPRRLPFAVGPVLLRGDRQGVGVRADWDPGWRVRLTAGATWFKAGVRYDGQGAFDRPGELTYEVGVKWRF